MFHPWWRAHGLSELNDTFDIAVVGGGITGCGIALDAAQRGLRTLLIEKDDIASGTSSRSSKLIHGGLRYLKQMQLRITRLACRERDRMLNLNPHLVSELPFLYPAYRGDNTPGWQVDLGLWMYDRLTGRPEKHSQATAEELDGLAPGLRNEGLDRALVFKDAMADDARLTLAVAATAAAYGCVVLTRCAARESVMTTSGRIGGLQIEDLESGRRHQVSARVVVNAAGVWTDEVRYRLGLEGAHLRPSRGIHLILASSLIPIQAAVTIASPDDGRPLFLIPHPEGLLLGTTDIYHDSSLDDPRPTSDEVDYLLRAVSAAFPKASVDRSQVRGAFAGLRPILDTYADNPSDASREEAIWEEKGALSVAGGKLTTWRTTAEEAVDSALRLLPAERARNVAGCATKGVILPGLAPANLTHRLEQLAPTEVADGLARRLGSQAWSVVVGSDNDELAPLIPGLDLCLAEVRHHLRWSAVLHLEDLLLRRVRLGMWDPAAARQMVSEIRPIATTTLGWDNQRWDQEVDRFHEALEGWTLAGVKN